MLRSVHIVFAMNFKRTSSSIDHFNLTIISIDCTRPAHKQTHTLTQARAHARTRSHNGKLMAQLLLSRESSRETTTIGRTRRQASQAGQPPTVYPSSPAGQLSVCKHTKSQTQDIHMTRSEIFFIHNSSLQLFNSLLLSLNYCSFLIFLS